MNLCTCEKVLDFK